MLTGTCHCGTVHWTFENTPSSATACNCSICRRYGVLWIYGHSGEDISLAGPTTTYIRKDAGYIAFHFCRVCGNVAAWRALTRGRTSGRRRMGVNLRLADTLDAVMTIPVIHFDGEAWSEGPSDHRCVQDMWY